MELPYFLINLEMKSLRNHSRNFSQTVYLFSKSEFMIQNSSDYTIFTGSLEGENVGFVDGDGIVGPWVGDRVGSTVGCVGSTVGFSEGSNGLRVGVIVGLDDSTSTVGP